MVRSVFRHGHSPERAVSQHCPSRERTKEEAAQSAEAINACRTAGCNSPEVIGCVEQALEENKAKFGYSVGTEKTVDATHDVFIKTVTSGVKPFLARMRKDEEEWAISKLRTCIEASRTQERRKRAGE